MKIWRSHWWLFWKLQMDKLSNVFWIQFENVSMIYPMSVVLDACRLKGCTFHFNLNDFNWVSLVKSFSWCIHIYLTTFDSFPFRYMHEILLTVRFKCRFNKTNITKSFPKFFGNKQKTLLANRKCFNFLRMLRLLFPIAHTSHFTIRSYWKKVERRSTFTVHKSLLFWCKRQDCFAGFSSDEVGDDFPNSKTRINQIH